MRLLEYEAKEILRSVHIPTPKSSIITSAGDVVDVPIVLKSQVPTGKRGKVGGIRIVEKKEDLKKEIASILSLDIDGYTPKVLLGEEKLDILHEYYLSILIDKTNAQIKLTAHTSGGSEIETNSSESFLVVPLDGKNAESVGERLAEYFELPSQSFVLQDVVKNLYQCFIKNDATLIEINPLMYTTDKKLIAGDCKMELDDAAAFRHPHWNFEDQPADSNFVMLSKKGSVATIANGAGLAMATVDAVQNAGMTPANFLDIGGGANSESVLQAFEKIMKNKNVNAIVINIFAGITRCDEVAKAIIKAKLRIHNLPPLYIRLAGTNIELARSLLSKHHISLLPTLEACLTAAKQEADRG